MNKNMRLTSTQYSTKRIDLIDDRDMNDSVKEKDWFNNCLSMYSLSRRFIYLAITYYNYC
jgi:hypothetical protein